MTEVIKFLNKEQVMQILDVTSNTTFWRLAKSIPYYRFGRERKYKLEDIKQFIESRRVDPCPLEREIKSTIIVSRSRMKGEVKGLEAALEQTRRH